MNYTQDSTIIRMQKFYSALKVITRTLKMKIVYPIEKVILG